MSEFASGNQPGLQAQAESQESQVWWSGRHGQDMIVSRRVTLDATTRDTGNTPSTTIRAGSLLGIVESTGKAHLYDPDANDGRQIAVGVLEKAQEMLVDGVAADRFTQMLVHGLLKESALVGLDARAKSQLAGRFVFDRDLQANSGLPLSCRGVLRKSGNYSVTAADNGKLMVGTAAVTFTLPPKENGLAFRFVQSANAIMNIEGASDILFEGAIDNNLVSYSVLTEMIGSHAHVECIYLGEGSLAWLVTNLGGTAATGS